MRKPRVRVPSTANKGEVFEVKSLVSHKMETGLRVDRKTGEPIPRMIINEFVARYNGVEVFRADWHPAVSANPYMVFHMSAQESGVLDLSWTDDMGETVSATKKLTIV